ncbi:hypothetical protein RDV84_00310 [Lysobacter yananisis]|uniref:Uncharacterized protein n=1 Tax=Lysobacter yananisis TaxID=1003114 RepID=A0ABY9P8E8_9GAMM|nr:hypothetical protein [Lysobacter yananisis]WMT03333.1 hypothetical protein RDV84_00310 [Lysobacter yananisis]
MSTMTANPGITPTQRSTIYALLIDRGLLTSRVSADQGDLFDRAGVAWREGQWLDPLLCSLSAAAAARLVVELTKESEE